MILTEAETRALSHRVLGLSKAESCIVTIGGGEGRHIRFAQNRATTSGAPSSLSIGVESHFGKQSGSASGTDLSDDGLTELVAASEAIARRAPENPEFMPPLGPQSYAPTADYAEATRRATPGQLAAAIAPVLREAEARKLQSSGFLQAEAGFSSFATSKGLFVYDLGTDVLQTITARTPDGTGSGWAGTTHVDLTKLDVAGLGSVAIDKAIRSQQPHALEPGNYTVILEPSAVSDLVGILIGDEFDQRSADEGRNFATKKGGGSLVGEKIFGDNVTVYSDPADAIVPGSVFSDDGLPTQRTMWIENGVLRNLQCGRFLAQK
jgi:predicted Zn-dependent protease